MRRATPFLFALLLPLAARADDTYRIVKADAKAAVGAHGSTTVTIVAQNGWHLNEEAPISVKLTPEAGVKVDKPKLVSADLKQRTKDKALFEVAFTATEPGKKTIAAEARFVTCQETTCKPVTEKFALALDVK